MDTLIYLDNAATTKPTPSVLEIFQKVAMESYGNPSSLHGLGFNAQKQLKQTREAFTNLLHCKSSEITFTSSGTEANNLAILGFVKGNSRTIKHIVTTKIEHASVLEPIKALADDGLRVTYLKTDIFGRVDEANLHETLKDEPALLCLSMVNSELGTQISFETIQTVKRRFPNIIIFLDAVQGFGKFPIHLHKTPIDLLTASSHKIHGLRGAGLLFHRNGLRLNPLIFGGGQENGLRSGTENVAAIVTFGLATQKMQYVQENSNITVMNTYARNRLLADIDGLTINSPDNASPYILNVSFSGIRSEVLLHSLETKNIFVSSGSACSSRKHKHSQMLLALGLSKPSIEGAIRLSFSQDNTLLDIDRLIVALKEILPQIQIRKRSSE